MSADLDALLTYVYVLVDDLLPARRRFGRPPRISDSELICLAVAQVLLDCPNERRFLRLAKRRLGHLFPYIPGQSGFNKRLRALAPQLLEAITLLARLSPSFCDRVRLLDSTPVPCAASQRRSAAPRSPGSPATATAAPTTATSGASASTCSAPGRDADRLRARSREHARARRRRRTARTRAAARPDRDRRQGLRRPRIRAAGRSLGGQLLRPDRKDEPRRYGSLGGIRQWIESTFDTLKDQLSLERHGGRTLPA